MYIRKGRDVLLWTTLCPIVDDMTSCPDDIVDYKDFRFLILKKAIRPAQ